MPYNKEAQIDRTVVKDSKRRDSRTRGFTIHRTRERKDGTRFDTIEVSMEYMIETERRKHA